MTRSRPNHLNKGLGIFSLTVLCGYFHAFMEWLFFVTKPSTLSTLSIFEKIKVLVVSGGVVAILLIVGLGVLYVPSLLTHNSKWKSHTLPFRFIPSAFMLSVTALISLDNFTYTLFKFGIITTLSTSRLIYALFFLITFGWMVRFSKQSVQKFRNSASFPTLGLFALSLIGILWTAFSANPYLSSTNISLLKPTADRPNIIILGSDGLSANYLSAYGNAPDTTPFLSQLIKKSLVAENAFPNASSTTASTTSILTGKEPADVRVYRYPDILSDEDSFEHLPGILRHQGYKTVEIGTSYYVDAEKLNLLDGFDIVNNKSMKQPALDALRFVLGNSPSSYFVQTIAARVSERLLHIFYIQDMENPLEEVNNPRVRMTDTERTDQIISLLAESERPLFIFSHFMDTHGPIFFSEGDISADESVDSEQQWNFSHYRDALRSFDDHVKEIYSYLEQSGELDNTILVIYTDHGYRYSVNQRIPMIIHFPNDENAGIRKNNVEIIDIPPTLLDYLGINQPKWMTGISVLDEEPAADRKIFSIVAGSPRKINPPFFQIKTVQVIVCQKWFALNVQENIWKNGIIGRHTSPCAQENLPTGSEIRQTILEYLANHGYDISSLE